MDRTRAVTLTKYGDAFSELIGRLRLTQGEIRRLLAAEFDAGRIVPELGREGPRATSVAGALLVALSLVGDDDLVATWLRSPLPRRGGSSPIDEAEVVEGDRLIRFVLQPHPAELVGLIAQRAEALPADEFLGECDDA